jgi:hypothetical protein
MDMWQVVSVMSVQTATAGQTHRDAPAARMSGRVAELAARPESGHALVDEPARGHDALGSRDAGRIEEMLTFVHPDISLPPMARLGSVAYFGREDFRLLVTGD